MCNQNKALSQIHPRTWLRFERRFNETTTAWWPQPPLLGGFKQAEKYWKDQRITGRKILVFL